jgi:hypothetical protein
MFADVQIRDSAQAMLGSVAVPAAPLQSIRERIARRDSSTRSNAPRPRRLAIAAAFLVAALPVLAYAVVSYEARSRAALEARGGWAPPRPPAAFVSKLTPKVVTLSQAQVSAGFALVAPTGLPAGASLSSVAIGPVGAYDSDTHSWRIGSNNVIFRYRRANRGVFEIIAERYDARDLPGRYIFEDLGPDAHGNPVLVRRESFAWRNGDQMMVVTTAGAINEGEILAIARSMRGTLLSLPWPSAHGNGSMRVLRP